MTIILAGFLIITLPISYVLGFSVKKTLKFVEHILNVQFD